MIKLSNVHYFNNILPLKVSRRQLKMLQNNQIEVPYVYFI